MQEEAFGPYTLVSLLGEGGMAKVYLAVKRGGMGFEKEVALKKIDSRLTEDQRFVRALINEARLGGQLRHKNIVEVYDFTQVGQDWCLEMEYVNGPCLDAIIRDCRNEERTIPPAVALEIASQVCRGLQYAHALRSKDGQPLNLVHRDLKPGNIILSRGGDAKIMDFGIAKADSNLYKTTAADITKGTPIYMSPEQVTGSAQLTARSDIFSLGSIIHEMLVLETVFQGDNLLAIMHKVLQADVRDAVAAVDKRVPGLGAVLRKAMAKQIEDRYPDAGAMEKDLRALLDAQGAGAPSLAEWVEEYEGWAPRHRDAAAGSSSSPTGTQSLAGVDGGGEDRDTGLGSFTRAFFADTAAGGAPPPSSSPLGAPAEPSPDAEAAMGELTKQFFQTEAVSAPSGPVPASSSGPSALGPAAAVTADRPAPAPATELEEPVPRRKRRLGLVVGALVLFIGVLIVGIVVVTLSTGLFGASMIAGRSGGDTGDVTEAPTEGVTEPATEGGDDGVAENPTEGSTEHPTAADDGQADAGSTEPATPEQVAVVEKPAIIFASTPSGADIYMDGRRLGRSAYRFEGGTAGRRYTVTYKKDGYEDATASGTFPGDGTITVRGTLVEQKVAEPATPADTGAGDSGETAYMTINSKPWATIYLDGQLLGNTPKKRYPIAAGYHEVVLKCGPCSEPQEHTLRFSVKPGETHTAVRNEFKP